VNGDGTIDYAEGLDCLTALGFPLDNLQLLRNVISDIDSSKTGRITEDEFLRFFETLNREKLEACLRMPDQAADDNSVRIRLIEYGFRSKADFRMREVAARDLHSVIVNEPAESKEWIRWFDFTVVLCCLRWRWWCCSVGREGLSSNISDILQNDFGLPKSTMQDVSVQQRSKVDLLHSVSKQSVRLHLVATALEVSGVPVEERKNRNGGSELLLLEDPEEPVVLREQMNIFIMDDRTVLSFRSPRSPYQFRSQTGRGTRQIRR